VCGTGRGGAAAFQTPRCGASISAQADGIDGALLREAIATSSSRMSRRRCYRFRRRRHRPLRRRRRRRRGRSPLPLGRERENEEHRPTSLA